MTELQKALTEIAQIDRKAEGIRLELFRRGCRFNLLDAGGWQLAWDRHPDLWQRHQALGPARWDAMDRRDALLQKQKRAAKRAEKAKIRKTVLKKCAACDEYSRVAA